jgi:NDP-sugar pyrophosphorylase family protein
MKAVILSGGNATRLRPLTNNIQKTMLEMNNKPLLWYHINQLKLHGIKNIWFALHRFPESVINYFGNGSKHGIKVNYSVEKKALGTAGALKNPDSNIEKHLEKERFLVVYGDNLTNFNYSRLIGFHKDKKAFLTIGLYKSPEPWTMGVVKTNKNGKVLKFIEKPTKEEITINTVSAGILVCEPDILQFIPDGFSDFGFDINPKLLRLKKPLFALNTGSYVQDTGTYQRLSKARKDFTNGKVKFDFL